MEYNDKHGLVPLALNKKISEILVGRSKDFPDPKYTQKEILKQVAEEKASYGKDATELIAEKQKAMEAAAKNLDFIKAAKLRDEIAALKG